MDTLLEDGLELVDVQPDCIKATFKTLQEGEFTMAQDDRGKAALFVRDKSPTVLVEVIKTAPGKIRGNHVHEHCDEALHVIEGELELYQLCEHKKHVFKRVMRKGDAVLTAKGTPHALRSITESECIVFFSDDSRNDRARVPILKF